MDIDRLTLEGPFGPRRVDVWVPPGAPGPLPVIYAHDGQQAFDPATSSDGVPWAFDRAVGRLRAERGLPGAVVVGMWHGPERWREYLPTRPVLADPALAARTDRGGPPLAAELLAWVVDELKPLVDARYPTAPGRASTSIVGSSMGGLASLHALTERPDVFGAAACLSTHWPAGDEPLVDAMADALPPPGRHRLYFDHGTEDLDAAYGPLQRRFDAALASRGWREGDDVLSRTFPGADHHERAWAARVHVPLLFLLDGTASAATAAADLGAVAG